MTNILLRLTRPMMRGPAVRRLQEIGAQVGVDFGKPDGIFGPETERGVLDLQRRLGLQADGVCGPQTWEALTRVSMVV